MALGQLGDVHQTLDALLDPDERTERHPEIPIVDERVVPRARGVGAAEAPRVLEAKAFSLGILTFKDVRSLAFE